MESGFAQTFKRTVSVDASSVFITVMRFFGAFIDVVAATGFLLKPALAMACKRANGVFAYRIFMAWVQF